MRGDIPSSPASPPSHPERIRPAPRRRPVTVESYPALLAEAFGLVAGVVVERYPLEAYRRRAWPWRHCSPTACLLAVTGGDLSSNFLTYHEILRGLLRADREITGGAHQPIIRDCFA